MSRYCLTKNQQVNLNDPKGWISVLFLRLRNRYGHAFTTLIPDRECELELKEEWVNVLKDTPLIRMKVGLERCTEPGSKFLTYPPSPMQFLELCQLTAEELNIPTLEECFDYILANSSRYDFQLAKLSHPFIKAIKPDNTLEFRELPKKDALAQLKKKYDIAKMQFLRKAERLPILNLQKDPYQIPIARLSEKTEAALKAHADKIAAENLDKCYQAVGHHSKYGTVLEYREKMMAAIEAQETL